MEAIRRGTDGGRREGSWGKLQTGGDRKDVLWWAGTGEGKVEVTARGARAGLMFQLESGRAHRAAV